MKENCKNCGAPYEVGAIKCKYCGTQRENAKEIIESNNVSVDDKKDVSIDDIIGGYFGGKITSGILRNIMGSFFGSNRK